MDNMPINENDGGLYKGKWITNGMFYNRKPVDVFHRQLAPMKQEKSDIVNKHVLFRKTFTMPENFTGKAAVRITADDYYKLYINGRYAAQGPCPGWPFHYYFNTVDVSAFIKPGRNVVAVHTYYQGLINRVWVSGDDRHGLIMELWADGALVLASDDSFLTKEHSGFYALGTAGYETSFLEGFDSASPENKFKDINYDDGGWENASIRKHLDYTLTPQPTAQLAVEDIAPVTVTKTADGYFYDFGGMYVGAVKAEYTGKKGETITILCGQELNEDGTVRYKMRCNCNYLEEWKLSGGTDVLEQFDYKAFRYVQLVMPAGFTQSPKIHITARHYPFSLKNGFSPKDAALRQIWDLCVRSLKYGTQDAIHDCMEREKGQYLGDMCHSAFSLGMLTHDFSILKKGIRDGLRSAFIDRGLVTCAPCSFMQEIADYPLYLPMTLCLHARYTGDTSFIEEVFEAVKDIILYYGQAYAESDGLLANIDKWCVVEWPANYRDGYDVDLPQGRVCEEKHIAINALYICAIKYMNKMARTIGRADVIDAEPLTQSFINAFYDRETKLFNDSPHTKHKSVPGNAYALQAGIFPEKGCAEAVIGFIKSKWPDGCMLFASHAVFTGMVRLGMKDDVLKLIAHEGCWLRMLREGATATFEGWGKDTKWNTSLMHNCLTYAVQFIADWDMRGALEF